VWADDEAEEKEASHFLVHVEETGDDGLPVHSVVSCKAVVIATGTAQCPR
jgi:hypothetical protein